MKSNALLRTILISFLLATFSAVAVEAPKPVITLFNDNIQVFISGLDIAGGGGIEALGVTEVINSNLPVSDPDKRKSRLKVRLKVKNSVNNAARGQYVAYVDTKSYPDPGTAVGTTYWCEEDGVVLNVDPGSEGFPCDFQLNIGIANSGATRYLVMGLALYSWYDNAAEGTVDIGRASVTVWDPATKAKLWRKVFNNTSGDWELEDNLSAVGDFQNADGIDEVRIVYSRGLPNNEAEMKYTYYDIATGSKMNEHRFTIVAP
jgi:hypothetical protein